MLSQCIRHCFELQFHPTTDGTLHWTQEPTKPTEVVEGKDIALKWDYNLTGDTFSALEWIYTRTAKTIGRRNSPSGKPLLSSSFPRFNISETEKATLIITNVNRTDTAKYSCKLTAQNNWEGIVSVMQLNVLCKYTNY